MDQKCRPVHFKEGDWVFLKVPENSTSLQMGSISKLSPQFCGPFKILQKVGLVAYKLELPVHSKIHPVFHVSRLQKHLLYNNNVRNHDVLVEFMEPPIFLHDSECFMDVHEL